MGERKDGIARNSWTLVVDSLKPASCGHGLFSKVIKCPENGQCLNAADVYVTTSLSDGTSVSLLEAISCGLPVVVVDAPAYFEWVEDRINGYIIPRRDSTVLAECLIALLQDPIRLREMGQRNL